MKIKGLFTCLFILLAQLVFANIITYPAPQSAFANTAYSIRVREAADAWQKVDVYSAKVAKVINAKTSVHKSAFAYFDCDGKVEVEVTLNNALAKTVKVRPASFGIKPVISGKTIRFFMSVSQYISIEVNGEVYKNLQLFANPIQKNIPLATDTNVLYYGPGIHHIGRLNIPSNKTIYIAGGAIVQGSLITDHAKNIRICGRGILTQLELDDVSGGKNTGNAGKQRSPRNDALSVKFSSNVKIEGIVVLPHKYSVLIGQSADISISDLKSFSSEGNADGIDIFCSSNIDINHIYMRNSDDCIAIYGHRWDFYGNTRNVNIKNAILWADVAHPLLIGTHGDSIHPDTLENINFTGINILEQNEMQMDYQGCIALNAGDSNLLRKIAFDGVTVDHINKGQLINIRVMFNQKYNTSPGKGIYDVYFKNITYNSPAEKLSLITGYDDTRLVKNIFFENLSIGGKLITDNMDGKPSFYKTGDMAGMYVGEHVQNIKFVKR
ncbi:endo-polygalacturonase [Mucilaginibacter sp. HMF5004]|uniref:glycosyl hydrolase family 28 protein n=1 Tax=Mucilaginibacter rivuli TaxID=2857527 RepID=UPI001C5F8332|nr:glycosyl hydrolase family 28 protein [Mucilaginibacter rivuli]MBW4889753.1 endo-polygalacturonase [Mucilaginibacter rivuli]